MERGWILSVATVMVFVAAGVRGASNTQVEITRAGCGLTKLCLETPGGCDPARTEDHCLFTSMVVYGNSLSIELSGQSQGYVALGLADESNTVFFICGQNTSANGSFVFRTMQRSDTDTELSRGDRNVTEVQGLVEGSVTQCQFNVPAVNAKHTSRSTVSNFSILLGTGRLDGDTVGPPNISLRVDPRDWIAYLASMFTTMLPPTIPSDTSVPVAPPSTDNTTTSGASSGPHPPSLFLLSIVLTWCLMQRA